MNEQQMLEGRRSWEKFRDQWNRDFAEGINNIEGLNWVAEHQLMVHSFRTGPITSWHMSAALEDTGWTKHKVGQEWCWIRPGIKLEDVVE